MKKVLLAMVLTLFFVTAAFAKVNLNTTGVDELQGLAGIGPANIEAS